MLKGGPWSTTRSPSVWTRVVEIGFTAPLAQSVGACNVVLGPGNNTIDWSRAGAAGVPLLVVAAQGKVFGGERGATHISRLGMLDWQECVHFCIGPLLALRIRSIRLTEFMLQLALCHRYARQFAGSRARPAPP